MLKKSEISSCIFLGIPRLVLREINSPQNALADKVLGLLVKAEFLSGFEEDSQFVTANVQRQNVLRIHFNHDVAAKTAAAVIEKWISSGLRYSVLIGLVFDELNLDIFTAQSSPFFIFQKLRTLKRFLDKILIYLGENALEISSDFMKQYEFVDAKKKVADVIIFCNSKGLFNVPFGASNVKSRMQLAVQHLCEEFHPLLITYPPTSMNDVLKVLKSFNLKAIHSYVSLGNSSTV